MEFQDEKDNLFIDCSIVKEEYSIQYEEALETPEINIKSETQSDTEPDEESQGVAVKEENPSESVQFVIEEISRERNHQCPVCNKFYYTVGQRNEHMKIHSDEKKFPCPHCPTAYSSRSRLKKHLMVHERQDLPCSICGKLFKNARSLSCHAEMHTNTERVECEMCGKTLKTVSSLKEHYLRVHCNEVATKTFSCEECGKTFGLQNHLKKHLKTHDPEKQFSCSKCSKRYKHPYDYRKHVSICDADSPLRKSFTCSVCKKSFDTNRGLIGHMKKHTRTHLGCFYCEKKFSYQINLVEHIKDVHRGLPTEEVGDGVVSCTICSGNFESLDRLTEHVKIHQSDDATEATMPGLPSNEALGSLLEYFSKVSEPKDGKEANEGGLEESNVSGVE